MDNIISMAGEILKSFNQTFLMLGISLTASIIFGLPLGMILYLTEKKTFFKNKFINFTGGFVINIIRSTPFVILLVLLIPFTNIVAGTTIGPLAASVPLSVAAIAFFARLVHGALVEVDRGVIEAATAAGAPTFMIIKEVLIPEAMPGLLRGLTVTAVSLVGYSAMAGIVGGGGVGDLAIRYGYYRYQTDIMIVTVVILIVLVQILQSAGDFIADKADKK